MTTDAVGWLPPKEEPVGALEAADVLKRLQDSALGLLGGLDRQPRSLRIKVNGVEIELEWPEPQPATVYVPAPVDGAVAAAGPAVAGVGGARIEAVPDDSPAEEYITAHMVGVFYRSREPGAKPFVEVGDVITPGQQLGIIEAMKLMIPIEAEVAGRIVDVLATNGASVEYGEKLFAIEPVE